MWVVFLLQAPSIHAEDLGELSPNPPRLFGSVGPSRLSGFQVGFPIQPTRQMKQTRQTRETSFVSPDSINNPFGVGKPYNPGSLTHPNGTLAWRSVEMYKRRLREMGQTHWSR